MIYQIKVSLQKDSLGCSRCPVKYFISNSSPVSFMLSLFYHLPVWIPLSSCLIAQECSMNGSFTFLSYFLKYTKRVTLERLCLVEFCVIYWSIVRWRHMIGEDYRVHFIFALIVHRAINFVEIKFIQ